MSNWSRAARTWTSPRRSYRRKAAGIRDRTKMMIMHTANYHAEKAGVLKLAELSARADAVADPASAAGRDADAPASARSTASTRAACGSARSARRSSNGAWAITFTNLLAVVALVDRIEVLARLDDAQRAVVVGGP